MTREESYSLAFENQQRALTLKKAQYDADIAAVSATNPRFDEICRQIAALGAKTAITALSGDMATLSELQRSITKLSAERDEILKSAGIMPMIHGCAKCLDTGYVNGKICDCIHTAAKALMLDELSKNLPLEVCRFENFDLNYYPNSDNQNSNPRKRMTAILKLCREYSINFDPQKSESLLFMGNTGLGKTHLTLSVVYELLNRGFNVIYGAAYNLFSQMESEHFSKHTDTAYNDAISCDLLVIDDLGGEFVSPYIQSLLYNIINTRDLSHKPTIINTNLSMGEIGERYTPRVASRLIKYTAKQFIGNDIRQLKAIENNK